MQEDEGDASSSTERTAAKKQLPLFTGRPTFFPPSPARKRTERERRALLADVDERMAPMAAVLIEERARAHEARRAKYRGTTVVLVGCSKQKLSQEAPAKDLYQGALFKLARAYAESWELDWAILSALHGLVLPEAVLAPYDHELPTRQRDLESWSGCVAGAVADMFPGAHLVVLASARYCSLLRARRFDAETPLSGLGIGKQRAWLKTHRRPRC